MANKYYAVKNGRKPGIYMSWAECQAQVTGFSGATFKSFKTLPEAEEFMAGGDNFSAKSAMGQSKDLDGNQDNGVNHGTAFMNGMSSLKQSDGLTNLPDVYAFCDGSYNIATKVYGYGGFLHYSNEAEDIVIRGHGNDPEEAVSRNVAGEVHGAVAAMEKALELGLNEITLFYDYEGVEKWPTGVWRANKKISQYYVASYKAMAHKLKVRFVHVPAHTGIPGNELADKIAKEEVGIAK